MNTSNFKEYVKYLPAWVAAVYQRYNDKPVEEQMLYKQFMGTEYVPDLKWSSKTINSAISAADVVEMDSMLPLKSRPSLHIAEGSLPKIGMALALKESEFSALDIMIARGSSDAEIAKKLFDDTTTCIKAVETRKEIMFQEALSTGYTILREDGNGNGVRVSFGYKENNFIPVTNSWSDTSNATPIDDINAVIDAANNKLVTFTDCFMSKQAFDYMRKTEQGKLLYANFAGIFNTNSAKLPVATPERFSEAFEAEFGIKLHVVNSTFKVEVDGVSNNVRPFAQANVVFVPDSNIGRVVYSNVVEATHRVNGVDYVDGEQGTLISKYGETNPLKEFTCAQAMALPVVDNGVDTYVLVTTVAQN